MKKFMTLILVLLLVFSIGLTGCGGGTEEPADTPDSTVEEDAGATVSKDELMEQYNVFAQLFNEVDGALTDNGTYDVDEDVKAMMDSLFDYLDKAMVVADSDVITDEERALVYDEFQTYIDQINGIKDTYM